ncbi:Gfo/Idh/MocA family oxidoreductase [Metasolibacillus sp. FSL H7-0170]|uniref:Gfo/Idh/MocA family oxidoreductase n=1 Tax=Metasolibacillus sp. FSL H7-0170 TaxID=2921431 RepID=UPI0031595035
MEELNYKPPIPNNKTFRIGIVGAGEIVREAHLPAYEKAGFKVTAIYNRTIEKAEQLAKRYNIPYVFDSIDELINHPEVDIVDIALTAEMQLAIVEKAVKAKKHILCQKPLADTYTNAKEIVALGKEHGVKIAVNQQMRWAPSIRAASNIINRGWIGDLVNASIQVNVQTQFENWPFLKEIETLEIMYHSIHYMDSIRFLFGAPEYIYADGARFPGQKVKGETRTMIHMKFKGEVRALIYDTHNNQFTQDDWFAEYRFEGTEGVIKGENGALYNYPIGREDSLTFTSNILQKGTWITPQLEGKWFPDAFIGTMGELMNAIVNNTEPENSAEDNLQTLQMVYAAYQSMKENRPVYLDEIK